MTYFADEASAAAALRDPATSRADLMSIAYAYPALGTDVARHANAYPGLLDWLEQFGTPKARAEVAAVRAETPPPLYRPARQDYDALQDTVLSPSAWTPSRLTAPVAPTIQEPAPAPTPAPAPAPTPAPMRVAAPVAVPTPTPVAVPTPTPVAVPVPAPVATPVAAPVATPTPAAPVTKAAESAEYVSPFDEYSDEPEPEPRPVAAKSDDETDDETDTHEPWSKGQKALVISLIAAIVVLAVAAGIIFGSILPNHRAYQNAQSSYQTAAQNFTDAQTALAAQIQAATPVSTVGPSNVNDATTLTALTTALATATAASKPTVPEMASTTSAINQQVTDLNNQTTDATNATQALQSAIDAVQQSRVDLAVNNLKTILADAQGSYDSASYMGDTPERTQLETMITQVTAATTNPSTLGSDTDSIVSSLQAMGPKLQQYIDAVNAANKVTANKTLSYLLQGDQVTCGVNVCYTGVGGGDPSTVASVQVTVKGSSVTAKLCFMSTEPVDPTTCQVTTGTDGNNGWSEAWTGTRDGTTAKIISTTKDKAEFSWGTLTFASSAPNAAVTAFAAADLCEKSDGTGYGTLVNGSCQ